MTFDSSPIPYTGLHIRMGKLYCGTARTSPLDAMGKLYCGTAKSSPLDAMLKVLALIADRLTLQ